MGERSEDDRLMMRYAGGDPEAFRHLYDRWEDRVFGFCLRFLGREAPAADAFQDTFRRLIEARRDYEPRGRFRSWLFTLARRACIDQLRSSPDEEEPLPPRAEGPSRRGPTGGRRVSPRFPDASSEEEVSRRDEIARLLSVLTEQQREVLLLAKYEGFSYREIADITGSTEAAVKQRVYRALKRLREEG